MRNFNAVLPPGWVQFDLSRPVREQVGAAVEAMVAESPEEARDVLRKHLIKPLTQSMMALASKGSVAVYMSAENPAAAAVYPTVAIRPAEFEIDGTEYDPLEYLVALIGTGEVELVEPVGMVGVKRVVDQDVTAAFREELQKVPEDLAALGGGTAAETTDDVSRRKRLVEYTIGVPNTDDCWMVVSADVSTMATEGADDVLAAVTEFLDAWVGTITWQEKEEEDE